MTWELIEPVFLRDEPRLDARQQDVFVEQSFRIQVLDNSRDDWWRIRATSISGFVEVEGWVKSDMLSEDAEPIPEQIDIGDYLNLLTFMARERGHGLTFRDYLGAVAWVRSGVKNLIKDRVRGPIGPYQYTVDQWSELIKKYGHLHLISEYIVDPTRQASLIAEMTSVNVVELTAFFDNLSRQIGEDMQRPNSGDIYLADLLGLDAAKSVLRAGKLQFIDQPLEEVYKDQPDTQAFVRKILDQHRDIMLADDKPKTIERTLSDLIETFNKAYEALKPHIENLPEGVRTSPSAGGKQTTLGMLSRKFEARGPGDVSTGVGDKGGVSYGSYQMTTHGGIVKDFVTASDFKWRDRFIDKMPPGESAFTAEWKQLAQEEPDAFFAAQHAYIKKTHFDKLVEKIKADDGLDVTTRSRALQDVVWSTAVHHGPNSTVLHTAIRIVGGSAAILADPKLDRRLIEAVYEERGRRDASGVLVHFPSSSSEVQKGVAERFVKEMADALAMFDADAA